jgi:hypothetical protein
MISSDKGVVTIECDSPGCMRSMARPVGSGINALDEVLRRAAKEGWMVCDAKTSILHLCPRCGVNEPNALPLYSHVKPDGKAISRGSNDPTGLLAGIVVAAQDLRAGQVVAIDEDGKAVPAEHARPLTAEQARKARAKRKREALGMVDVPEAKRQELADKLERGKQAFTLSINLDEDPSD